MINRRLSCLCFEIVFILRLVVSVLNELNSNVEQLSMFHYFLRRHYLLHHELQNNIYKH